MEGLAAISLATNILQFIDRTCHILGVGSQVPRHGISDFHMNLDRTAKELEYQILQRRDVSSTPKVQSRQSSPLPPSYQEAPRPNSTLSPQ